MTGSNSMKIIVTGGSGKAGRRVVREPEHTWQDHV